MNFFVVVQIHRLLQISFAGILVGAIPFLIYLQNGPKLQFKDWNYVKIDGSNMTSSIEIENTGQRDGLNTEMTLYGIFENLGIFSGCKITTISTNPVPVGLSIVQDNAEFGWGTASSPDFFVVSLSTEDYGLFFQFLSITKKFGPFYFEYEDVKNQQTLFLADKEIQEKLDEAIVDFKVCNKNI